MASHAQQQNIADVHIVSRSWNCVVVLLDLCLSLTAQSTNLDSRHFRLISDLLTPITGLAGCRYTVSKYRPTAKTELQNSEDIVPGC